MLTNIFLWRSLILKCCYYGANWKFKMATSRGQSLHWKSMGNYFLIYCSRTDEVNWKQTMQECSLEGTYHLWLLWSWLKVQYGLLGPKRCQNGPNFKDFLLKNQWTNRNRTWRSLTSVVILVPIKNSKWLPAKVKVYIETLLEIVFCFIFQEQMK